MCLRCVTPAQTAYSTAGRAALQRLTMTTYAELQAAQPPGSPNLNTSGFPSWVREIVVNKAPKFLTKYTQVNCAYCRKPKDLRSMEVEHVIPVRAFVRAKLYERFHGQPAASELVVANAAQEFYIDTANLALVCKGCNRPKSDTLPNEPMPRNAGLTPIHLLTQSAAAFADPAARGTRQAEVLALDRLVATLSGAGMLARYLRGDLKIKMSNPVRSAPGGAMRAAAGRLAAVRHSPMGPASGPPPPAHRATEVIDTASGATLPDRVEDVCDLPEATVRAIEKAIIAQFAVSRRNIKDALGARFDTMLAHQSSGESALPKDLRVCLYCNGLFHKQAFQIEHVLPANRNAMGQSDKTVAQYNNRLLPICGSCNGSRQKSALNRTLLDELCEARKNDGLPGLEGICDDLAAAGRQRLFTLLGIT